MSRSFQWGKGREGCTLLTLIRSLALLCSCPHPLGAAGSSLWRGCSPAPMILEVGQARATSYVLTVYQLLSAMVKTPAFEMPRAGHLEPAIFFLSPLVLGVGRAARALSKLPRASENENLLLNTSSLSPACLLPVTCAPTHSSLPAHCLSALLHLCGFPSRCLCVNVSVSLCMWLMETRSMHAGTGTSHEAPERCHQWPKS